MSRYAITILVIAAIIFAAADSAGAAPPSAEIVSPSSPIDANMLERLEFIIRGTDPDNDLLKCDMSVDDVFKGRAYFNRPESPATAKWTYAFGTPGTRTVAATPYDLAENKGAACVWTVEVRNVRGSLELTVLAYNTHLFEESILECICRCGQIKGLCTWSDYNYDDWTRRTKIADAVAASEADIVALQEVWAPCWQQWFAETLALEDEYPYSATWDSSCVCWDVLGLELQACLGFPGNMINNHCCGDGCCAETYTLGNGLVLLSKWSLSNIEFERFPTFTQCGIGDCEAWSDKGVLTADVNVGEVTIRVGISHALTRPHDEKSMWDTDHIATTTTPFQLKGEAYIFALDRYNTGHIVKMEDYGRWWDEKEHKYNSGAGWKHLYAGLWYSNYDVVRSFEMEGHPYLFTHGTTNNDGHIFRINDDPSTGWSHMYGGAWESDLALVSFQLDRHPYLFALHDANTAYIHRINDDPCTGWTVIYEGSMSSDYVDVTSFELDEHPYLFVLHAADIAYIHRINDDPCTGWTTIYEGSMSSEHFNVTSFELDGHPYLFGTHTNNNSYIYRINDDPCTGWTYVYGDPRGEYLKAWYRFEYNTLDSSGNGNDGTPHGTQWPDYSTDSRGEAYSIKLDGVDDYVEVGPVGISGNSPRTIAGWVRATKPPDEMTDWRGIFGFTGPAFANTHFDIQRHGGRDYYCIHVYGWEGDIAPLDQEWHHLAATYDGNKIAWYAEGSMVGSEARVLNTNDNLWMGRRWDRGKNFPGLVDDVRIYSRALSQGEIALLARSSIAVFEMNGHPYLFLQGNCCDQYIDCTGCRPRPGEAYLMRIKDDPTTGWEDILQLEDIKIIRDQTIVAEDGPPAIMMGDFNIHAHKNGIMDRLFGKAGAVDAYIEVHGTGEGGDTVDLRNNKFAQKLCKDDPSTPGDECDPDDPRVYTRGRIDYVYVKQSGAGVRLVPTEARVIRDWQYGAEDMDLSDHYPVAVKFKLFQGGCTARMKGDLNCDRLINFVDFAILCSVWMSEPNDISWDPACDISEPPDGIIDMKDIEAFVGAWLTLPPIHNVTQNKWYTFIQTAITYASDGDEIEVAPGTYYEAINFKHKAIRLYSSGGPEVTTIDGNGAYHVVQCVSGEGPDTVLDGFTITGGNASGGWPDRYGGGMYNQQSSPTVTNCIFTGNSASSGGGMYNNNNSSPMVNNCIFNGNSATFGGGGMYNYENSNPTVSDCNFTGNSSLRAGGMFNERSSPTLTDCIFFDNQASGDTADMGGGGMRNLDNSDPTITNCTFVNNTAGNYGGGMYNTGSSPTVTNCTFSGNSADHDGGGMCNVSNSSPTVTDCVFSGNTVTHNGGGMYNASSNPTVTNCTFTGNSSNSHGGGICNVSNSSPTLTNCIFNGNDADGFGGGMINSVNSNANMTNCVFIGNAADYGGGIYNNDNSNAIVTNCTFSGNNAANDGGGMHNAGSSPTVTNCILWGDVSDEISNNSSNPTVTYSDVQGGWSGSGGNNIDADPCFVDANNPDPNLWNLRLKPNSPCIDSGDNSAVPSSVTTDLDGNPRFVDDLETVDTGSGTPPIVDMGAYEYQPSPPATAAADFKDLAILCANWLSGKETEL